MSYFSARLRWLLKHPGFREHPVLVSGRLARWLVYCAVGHSPRFQLVNGVQCKVDPILRQSGSTSAFVLREWAEPELRYLHQLLSQGDAFIDCGANIGSYTLCAAAIVGPHGKVLAIEPSAVSLTRLRTNIDLNGFTQVVLVNKAVSDVEATARLYHADGGPVSFSPVRKSAKISRRSRPHHRPVGGESGLDRVDGIKLDEGAEIRRAAGRGHFNDLNLVMERTSPGAKRLGPMEMSLAFAAHGYHLYQYSRTGFNHPNFVAIHSDRGTVPPTFLESCSVNNCIS